MTRTMHVFLACALGGGIGALVALSLWRPLWWLGGFVGFAFGYLAYEPMAVLHAIPRAWARATSKRARVRWRIYFRHFAAAASVTSYLPPLFFFVVAGEKDLGWMFSPDGIRGMARFTLFMTALLAVLAVPPSFGRYAVRGSLLVRSTARHHVLNIMMWWRLFRLLAGYIRRWAVAWPQVVAFAISAMNRSQRHGVALYAWLRRFGWHLFLEIHSQGRLLCGADAMLGTAIGYFFGHAIIGAMVGGLLGAADYELISKRWLGLSVRW